MKAVILAGGLGTRLSEETYLKPKPMVEIEVSDPLHIMKLYFIMELKSSLSVQVTRVILLKGFSRIIFFICRMYSI